MFEKMLKNAMLVYFVVEIKSIIRVVQMNLMDINDNLLVMKEPLLVERTKA